MPKAGKESAQGWEYRHPPLAAAADAPQRFPTCPYLWEKSFPLLFRWADRRKRRGFPASTAARSSGGDMIHGLLCVDPLWTVSAVCPAARSWLASARVGSKESQAVEGHLTGPAQERSRPASMWPPPSGLMPPHRGLHWQTYPRHCARGGWRRGSRQALQIVPRTVREVWRLAAARALLSSDTRASPETWPETWQKAPWQRDQISCSTASSAPQTTRSVSG